MGFGSSQGNKSSQFAIEITLTSYVKHSIVISKMCLFQRRSLNASMCFLHMLSSCFLVYFPTISCRELKWEQLSDTKQDESFQAERRKRKAFSAIGIC